MPKRRQLHGRVLTRLNEHGCGYIEMGADGFLAISGDGTYHANLTPTELIQLGIELVMHGTEMLGKWPRFGRALEGRVLIEAPPWTPQSWGSKT